MTMYANDGTIRDITDDLRMAAVAAGQTPSGEFDHLRRFHVRCGGCPWWGEMPVSKELLADPAYSDNKWLTFKGWSINPIRCPYCTGKEQRPAGEHAAPYPIKEA